MNRIVLAFRAFFALLFSGKLSAELLADLGVKKTPAAAPAPKVPPALAAKPADGALQLLAILQRDSRLVDFLQEDIATYSDDQIGAAVRSLHDQCRDGLARYIGLEPVIDGVEGTYTKTPSSDPALVKFIGNVPAQTPAGGTLRHKGWRAVKVDLPTLNPKQDSRIIYPAEIEIE